MTPFLGVGDNIEWTLPDSLMAGSSRLTIACTPYTRISATYDSLLLGTTISHNDGLAQLTFCRTLHGDSLTLTASRPGAIPLVTTLPIKSPLDGRLAVTRYVLDDSVLNVTVKNVGQKVAHQHRLQLMQDSCDRTMGATFGTLLPTIQTELLPQEDATVVFHLGRLAIGNEPMLAALLIASDSLGQSYDTLHITTPTPDLRPKIVAIAVLDSVGDKAKTLLPEKRYLLMATLSHPADSVTHETLHGSSENLYPEEVADGLEISSPFTVEEGTEHIFVSLTAHKDYWQHHYEGWLVSFNTWERFETGDFENLPWQQSSLYPWQIDSNRMHGGHYCTRSATIGNAQKSTLALDVETLVEDSVSFWYRVSSEANDWLYFFIDGRKVGYWSGNSGWQRYVRILSAGRHRLEWTYQKDASQSEREDCAYIDDVRLPLAMWQRPYGTSERDSNMTVIRTVAKDGVYKLYPNPTSGNVTIELESSTQPRYLELFDMCGRMIDKIFIPPDCNSTQYFTTLLRFGMYTMVLHDQTGSHVQKLIVTKKTCSK